MSVVDTAPDALAARQLRDAFGAFPTGVTVVGAVVDGRPVGMAASSFTSVSLDPPIVSVAVAHTSTTWPRLAGIDRLGVSVLAGHHHSLVSRLAGPSRDRFAEVAWHTASRGELALEGAAATFLVERHSEIVTGDHTVVFLEVRDVVHDRDAPPLVFHRSRVQRLA